MSTGKKIMSAIIAWFVCHFTLHIAFAAVSTDNPPNGLIAVINFLVAGAVYFWTGQRNKAKTSIRENTEIEKIAREAELRSAQEVKIINKTESEMKQQNEEFIELLKSSISENGLDTIPGDDLIEIYKQARSIEASSNIPDDELSKPINTLLEEINKRGLSPEDKTQKIDTYKNSFLKQSNAGEGSKWVYAIAIPIIVIAIALVMNKSFSPEAPKAPTFDIKAYYEDSKDYYGNAPLEEVARDVYERGFKSKYPDYESWKKDKGLEAIIQEDNDRRKSSLSDKFKKFKIPFPFRFSEEPINGILFRYDRFTGTVERQFGETWSPQPRLKNLQHARDFMARLERNRQIRAIEEQTEAMERLRKQQQINGLNTGDSDIMRRYKEDKLRHDVEDIKNTLEAERRDQQIREMNR